MTNGCQGWEEGGGESACLISIRGDKNVLELDRGGVCKTLNVPNDTEL